jgi:hypothetical protein
LMMTFKHSTVYTPLYWLQSASTHGESTPPPLTRLHGAHARPPPPRFSTYHPPFHYTVFHTTILNPPISTNVRIPPHTSFKSNTPGVYIFLFKHLRTFALSFKLSHMTERRKLVLDFIKAYIRLHGISPSYEVIARGIGMKSRSAIHRIVHRLQDEGYLVTKPHKFCSIRIVDKSVKEMASL